MNSPFKIYGCSDAMDFNMKNEEISVDSLVEHYKNKEKNEGFSESMYSQKTGKKVNFFNLGFNNRWQKILPNNIKEKIYSKLNDDLVELGYLNE